MTRAGVDVNLGAGGAAVHPAVSPVDGSESAALLIDASIYIFRYYFSLPDNWHSRQGLSTSAVYGYSNWLLQLLELQLLKARSISSSARLTTTSLTSMPLTIAACYDQSLGSGFRHQLYPAYKSSRALPDEELAQQLAACRQLTELLGIASFGCSAFEADDYIGSLVNLLSDEPAPIAILSRDKDLGQLLRRPQDYLWACAKPADEQSDRMDRQAFTAKFGVMPEQFVDYLALVGDAVDDIPGVPGIGAKTARGLLNEYGCLEAIFAQLDQLQHLPLRGSGKLAQVLTDNIEFLALSRQLALIAEDAPLGRGRQDLHWSGLSNKQLTALAEFFDAIGFPRLLARAERLARERE